MRVIPLSSSCQVCGSPEVRTDWVVDRGWVLLRECPRCQHRTTEPVPEPAPARARARPRKIAAA